MDATAGGPDRIARVIAVLCQLWCWLGPFFVIAIVVRFTAARRDPFLRATTAEVLDLQLVALALLVLAVGAVATGAVLLSLITWLAWSGVVGYGSIVGVIGAWKAWHGVTWPYPVSLHALSRT